MEDKMGLNMDEDYFEYVKNHPECKIIVYGAGCEGRKNIGCIGHIDYFCDRQAESFRSVQGIPCILPGELVSFHEKLIILICVLDQDVAEQICADLGKLDIEAKVFYYFGNPSFSGIDMGQSLAERWKCFDKSEYAYCQNEKDKLKICIVYREDGWILGKFARKLQQELCRLGQEAYIVSREDPTADVNHYIHFERLPRIDSWAGTVRTSMITHVNCQQMKDQIQYQARNHVVGICMSAETCNKLYAWGIPADKVCYVNPARDDGIKPKKIVLGITNRCYSSDFRKRDDLIVQVCRHLDPSLFYLKIMGAGWDEFVCQLRIMGFSVDYYPEFEMETYRELMAGLDYWIFSGFDEGGMGYLDALAAGVKTIVTPQGFHLDTKYGLTHSCSTINDFINTLKQIQEEKKKIISAVETWTWENYARKHLEIWQYLTRSKPLRELYAHQSEYMDGIYSLMIRSIEE